MEWLHAHKSLYETHHSVAIDDSALAAAVQVAKDRFADKPLLSTAKSLLDAACAYVRVQTETPLQEINELKRESERLKGEKEQTIRKHDYERANTLRQQAQEIQNRLDELYRQWRERRLDQPLTVTDETVRSVLELL